MALVFTGRYLTDTVTAYKMFTRADIASLPLETSGFELDHEITAQAGGAEENGSWKCRSVTRRARANEGKKIGARDWWIAVNTYWRYGRKA